MADRTGRLDLLLLGIVERIASRDPVYLAVYQVFEPELREMLKPLDSPRLRRAVKALAEGQQQTANGMQQTAKGMQQTANGMQQTAKGMQQTAKGRQPKAVGSRKGARPGVRSAVTVTAADGKAEVVEAEWIQ
jgi:methyl-accepting chemotaxis protein